MTANFTTAAGMFDSWRKDVDANRPPPRYRVGSGDLDRIALGPGRVLLLGGPPGAGKTAFTMQLVVDALTLDPALKALVANVEMPPASLLDRQLARLANIPLDRIRDRALLSVDRDPIEQGLRAIESLAPRLAFLTAPFDLDNAAASADDHKADLLVLDYIQRIRPPGKHADQRGSVDASMDCIRKFADCGIAVIVVAAVSRSRDSKGRSSYSEGLNLASFRESSELEFGCDDAYILTPDDPTSTPSFRSLTLRHLKSRHGECVDLALEFDGSRQRFTPTGAPPAPAAPPPATPSGKGRAGAAWKQAWNGGPTF